MTGYSVNDIFHDPDVDRAVANNGEIVLDNGTRVCLPSVFGFCGGVLRALNLLGHTLAENPGRPVWLLGEIIHNPTVNRFFRERGATILPHEKLAEVFEVAQPGDRLVIPAFGISADLDRRIREFAACPGNIIDATCGYVRRIWTFVASVAARNGTVIIHGKPDHPETLATLSRALGAENTVILVADLAEAETLARMIRQGHLADTHDVRIAGQPKPDLKHLALVNQTTMLYRETAHIESLLRKAVEAAGGELWAPDTVCRATQDRQDAARQLCRRRLDVIMVVGGFDSSNTNQLYRLAKETAPTFFVSDAEAIQLQCITHFIPETGSLTATSEWLPKPPAVIGVLAGASCPPTDIGGVIRRLAYLNRV